MYKRQEPAGVDSPRAKGVPEAILAALPDFGVSSICNLFAALSCAKVLNLGADDVSVTVGTDGGQMYPSERVKIKERDFGGDFTPAQAAEVWGRHLANVPTDGTLEMTEFDKDRIFNLGYYTGVEQQGTPFELFEARRSQESVSYTHPGRSEHDDGHAYAPAVDAAGARGPVWAGRPRRQSRRAGQQHQALPRARHHAADLRGAEQPAEVHRQGQGRRRRPAGPGHCLLYTSRCV